MRSTTRSLVLPLVLLVVLVVRGEGDARAQAMAPYVSPTGLFSIVVPSHWEQRPLEGGGFIALSPQESGADLFRENVNVVFESLPVALTAQQYAALSFQNMGASLANFRIVEQGQGPLGAQTAYWAVYTHTMNQPLMVLAFFVVSGGRGYVVTCTGTPVEFARWRPVFAQVANTFRPMP
jgi:hypothetical protein